jgi:DNA polymerase
MADDASAFFPPDGDSLAAYREAARGCRACDLWERGTQTVFGDGEATARLVFVGEQPGDAEDESGLPFVGPAGRLLDRALEDAGIDRRQAYVTNAVKHFKWVARGRRRIHEKPNAAEVRACRPWLDAELTFVRPDVLVLLGATAAQAPLLGPAFRVSTRRGIPVDSPLAPVVIATVHPSSILRARDDATRHTEYERFVADLRVAATFLQSPAPTAS